MKKALSLIIALVLVATMSLTAFAAGETYDITINNKAEGHTYEAYQIFKGDLSEGVLSNIAWGAGVSADGQSELGDAATKAASLTNDNASAFAAEVAPYLTTASKTSVRSGDTYVINDLEAGYYLIKDASDSLDNDHDSYTSYILEVTANKTIAPKSDNTTLIKKVDDKNDSTTTEDAIVWQDSADYDIGDVVPFKLEATLADNVTDYKGNYKVVFHDYMCDGLTFDASSVKVFVGDENTTAVDASKYTVVTTGLADGCDFEVVINDVEAMGATDNSIITVTYNATLNTNAKLGAAGNDNIAYLTYSNNPNQGADADGDGIVDETEGKENEENVDYGKTPEDKVIVFTYKVVVNKVKYKSGSSTETEALNGAEFKLEKKVNGSWVDLSSKLTVSGNVFTFTGIDDGEYKITETKTPAGFNNIEPIEFTVSAEHVIEAADPTLTKLEATGLAADTITGDISTGTITTDILNLAGATLPSTGGIGTTIFYVVGGLLMVAAVVVLVAKKRVGAED